MKIKISQNLIDAGEPENSQGCPLALACLEVVPDAIYMQVEPTCVTWGTIGEDDATPLVTYAHDAETWIEKFDSGEPVEPITVNLSTWHG